MNNNVYAILTAMVGTVMTCAALNVLVPEGMWLYLISLVAGTQLIVMGFRAVINQ